MQRAALHPDPPADPVARLEHGTAARAPSSRAATSPARPAPITMTSAMRAVSPKPLRSLTMTAPDQAIATVVRRMEAIAVGLPAADGVARFNDLYLAVTRAVLAEAHAGDFEHPELLARLDVVFAGLYFAAIDDEDAPARRPAHAWRPLFAGRASRRVAPMQFALAGMNAHINHDLALALVAVLGEFGVRPDRGTPHHRDYLRVNALLARVEAQVKRRFYDELTDEALGRVDDVIAIWSVARARDAAWSHAGTLWVLRHEPGLHDPFVDSLDRLVGLASRGLLLPTL